MSGQGGGNCGNLRVGGLRGCCRLGAWIACAAACAAPAPPSATSLVPVPDAAPAVMARAPVAPVAVVETVEVAAAAAPASVREHPTTAPIPPVTGEVAAALARIEARLARGDVVRAMAELAALHASCPDDHRVRTRLVRLLHQRALGRYGAGAVAAAVADWESVLRLAPDHAAARASLSQATPR
jgi:hypothetical protein